METAENHTVRILFVLNGRSGSSGFDFKTGIQRYFEQGPYTIQIFEMPEKCTPHDIRKATTDFGADRVAAVGGDGTIKLVAEALLETTTPLCIIPAGSANGMARELGIPEKLEEALAIAATGRIRKIHLVRVNDELCIHLSDIGLNAFMVKRFESLQQRGMWGYMRAAWQTFWSRYRMQVDLYLDGKHERLHAFMIVIANATMYGTGAKINPIGNLDDTQFEVVVLKKISLGEIYKMWISHEPYHPQMTRLFQTRKLQIKTRKRAHFQVDGEYLGKIKELKAEIIPEALEVIVPHL